MSPPAKPEEGAKPKSSASSKAWAAFGATIAIGVAVVAILYVVGGLLGPAADGMGMINSGLSRVNEMLREFRSESRSFIMTAIGIILLPVLLFLAVKFATKKGDAEHH